MIGKLPVSIVRTVALSLVALGLQPLPTAAGGPDHWVGTWTAALHSPSPGPAGLTNAGFSNRTLRQIVHTSVGGHRVRVRLSTIGAGPVVIGAARIARRDVDAVIDPESDRVLTFAGEPSIRIPAGAVVVSDPVDHLDTVNCRRPRSDAHGLGLVLANIIVGLQLLRARHLWRIPVLMKAWVCMVLAGVAFFWRETPPSWRRIGPRGW